MGQGHDQFCVVLKNAREVAKKILKTIFIQENARNFGAKTFSFFFFFLRSLARFVLGPWPREGLSSVGLFLASDFFVSLFLASSVVSSTPPLFAATGNSLFEKTTFVFVLAQGSLQ